jgi:hypothetical protein
MVKMSDISPLDAFDVPPALVFRPSSGGLVGAVDALAKSLRALKTKRHLIEMS